MNASEILAGLSANESKLLLALDRLHGKAAPEQVFEAGGFSQMVEVMNAGSWLQAKGAVEISEAARKVYSIRDASVLERGLPERRAICLLAGRGGDGEMADLAAQLTKEETSIALGWLRKKNLATISKVDGRTVLHLTDDGRAALDRPTADEVVLEQLARGEMSEDALDKAVIAALRSRQDLVSEKLLVTRTMELTDLGRELVSMGLEVRDEVAQLTPELIQTGKWKDVQLRRYDVRTFAPAVYPGKKHPLTRIADEIRAIFVDMGFTEIDEEYVQPAFWNMDALFTPQDHPARELQDTFYLKNPCRMELEDEDIIEREGAAENAYHRQHHQAPVAAPRAAGEGLLPQQGVPQRGHRRHAPAGVHPDRRHHHGGERLFRHAVWHHQGVLPPYGVQERPVPPWLFPLRGAWAGGRGGVQGQLA